MVSSLPDWYMQIALPVLIAFLTGLIGALFRYLQDMYERAKERRLRELKRAQTIHDDIIQSLDRLYTLMKWDVWYIALRHGTNSKQQKDGGPWKDDKRWNEYKAALDHWRMHDLLFQSQTKAYFTARSKVGGPHCTSHLITQVTDKLNMVAYHLWRLYWENILFIGPTGSSSSDSYILQQVESEETYENEYDPVVSQKNEEIELSHNDDNNRTTKNVWTTPSYLTEVEANAKAKYDTFISEIDQLIQTLSWTMTQLIQDENVGKLRKTKY